jgi:hypothetical protein
MSSTFTNEILDQVDVANIGGPVQRAVSFVVHTRHQLQSHGRTLHLAAKLGQVNALNKDIQYMHTYIYIHTYIHVQQLP